MISNLNCPERPSPNWKSTALLWRSRNRLWPGYSHKPEPPTSWSPRGLIVFAGIVAAILAVAALGLAVDIDPDSAFLYPAAPAETPTPAPDTTIPVVEDPVNESISASATAFDPLGDGAENDGDAAASIDGDQSTNWETERYPDPISTTKTGVGLILTAEGPISVIEITGSPGTRYSIGWASEHLPTPDEWQMVGTGTLLTGTTRHQVPKSQGVWLLWLTSLPEQPDGTFAARISNVSMIP